MIVVVTESEVRVTEVDNLRELAVDAVGVERAAVARAGELDGDHVWIPVAFLRGHGDAEWQQKFDAMIDYAATKGWTDADRVRAHIRS